MLPCRGASLDRLQQSYSLDWIGNYIKKENCNMVKTPTNITLNWNLKLDGVLLPADTP